MAAHLNYINYFRNLAVLFLAHTSDNKTFYKKGIEEFLSGLTTDGNYPAMLLERYDFKYKDNGSDRITKARTVGFTLFSHVGDTGDYDAIDNSFDECELILDRIYNKIKSDTEESACPNFLRYADMNSFDVSPVENTGDGNYGWFITFEIESVHNYTLT